MTSDGHEQAFVVAARRVLHALVALPRQIIALVRAAAGRSRDPSGPSSHPTTERSLVSKVGRAVIGLLIASAASAAAIVLLFSLARAIYYPFWAVGASSAALERSWGGPSPVGATLVHWVVAAVTILVAYGVILVMERLAGERR
jgi:hypothetical protein